MSIDSVVLEEINDNFEGKWYRWLKFPMYHLGLHQLVTGFKDPGLLLKVFFILFSENIMSTTV